MKTAFLAVVYVLGAILTGFLMTIVTAIGNQPSGEPLWGWVILCAAFWPLTVLYAIGFFLFANMTL